MKKAQLPLGKIRLPKIKVESSTVIYLSILVLTFMIGYYWNDNAQLQKQVNALNKNTNTAGNTVAAAAAPTPSGKLAPITGADHIYGNKDAAVTLVEYSDLECPYCKDFNTTLQQVLTDYQGKVNWVFRNYPLSFHTNAEPEAKAAECVAIVGGSDTYYSFIEKIFERTTSNGTGFSLDALAPLAKEVGVDEGKYTTCMSANSGATKVSSDMATATDAGVTGTPGTFVLKKDGTSTFLSGAVSAETLKSVIDAALK
jgi:protein-disulfide isomerase